MTSYGCASCAITGKRMMWPSESPMPLSGISMSISETRLGERDVCMLAVSTSGLE